MENISLFRKWRSQTFDEIVSQTHITKTLRNVIKNPKLLSHAYLFCGPRGTGKTSMARIFAKALNCIGDGSEKPCGKCKCCKAITNGISMDVMEIDAASHTSVEMVREHIINRVNFAPVEGKYKIYIIDEVHKLSGASFNALLKTLEEPPSHVIFILATTNPNDLPATIISRCQKFEFRRISSHDIMGRLRQICIAEGFKITESALSIIASLSSGALRDAIVLLEQAVSFSEGEINVANISSLLGLADSSFLFDVSELVAESKTGELLKLVDRAIRDGREPMQIIKDIIEHYRKILLVSVMNDANSILDLPEERFEEYKNASMLYSSKGIGRIIECMKTAFEAASAIKDSYLHRPLLEMALIRMSVKVTPVDDDSKLSARVARLERALASGETFTSNLPIRPSYNEISERNPETTVSTVEKPSKTIVSDSDNTSKLESKPTETGEIKSFWNKIMMSIKADRMSIYAILSDPNVSYSFSGKSISISVKIGYDFHKSQIEKNIAYIKDMACKVSGVSPDISVSFNSQQKKDKQQNIEKTQIKTPAEIMNEKHRELVKDVLDIFGGRVIQL